MSWTDLADLAHLAVRATFGRAVTYARGASSDEVRAVFDPSKPDPATSTVQTVTVRRPVLTVRLADLPNGVAEQGDQVTVDAVIYRVEDVRPDGSGGADLVLRRRSA